MQPIILAIAITFSGHAAYANIFEDCTQAIAEGDKLKAEELAATMLRFNSISTADQALGAACLSYARGEEYVYVVGPNTFLSKASEETRLKEEKEKAVARAQESEKRLKERELLELAERKRTAAIEAQKEERRQAVWKRVSEACTELYQDDPEGTVTNQICLDVFLQTGLPSS